MNLDAQKTFNTSSINLCNLLIHRQVVAPPSCSYSVTRLKASKETTTTTTKARSRFHRCQGSTVRLGCCGSHAPKLSPHWIFPYMPLVADRTLRWITTWTLISFIKCFHSNEVECKLTAMFCIVPERCLFSSSSNLSMDFSHALLSKFWYEMLQLHFVMEQ